MTVGVVVVSHSDQLARGVAELATQMAPDAVVATAGGTDEGGIGTSLDKTLTALAEADDGSGVVVLYDLGSAEMIAQTALEFLDDAQRARVRLSDAPLVTATLAAATAAQGGGSLDDVVAAAAAAGGPAPTADAPRRGPADVEATVTLPNPLGLHARPAALVVTALRDVDADVRIEHLEGGASASGRSLLGLVGLAAAGGSTLRLQAWGREAQQAIAALRALAEDGFGEDEMAVATEAPPVRAALPSAAARPGERVAGTAIFGGVVLGPAARLGTELPEVPDEPEGDRAHEQRRLAAARRAARRELEALARGPGGPIMEAQALLLDDPELDGAVEARLARGSGAAAAWAAAVEEQRQRLADLPGEVFKARAADVVDVGRRVLHHLLDTAAELQADRTLAGSVVVADDLVPSQVAQLREAGVAGIALARGAATSHSAILARNLGLPLVLGLGEALRAVDDGTTLLLDAADGSVVVDPPEALRDEAERRREAEAAAREARLAGARKPGVLADGTRVVVAANASTPAEARAAFEHGAEGIGLLRTEVAFLGRPDLPSEDEQVAALAGVCAGVGGGLVVVRTLDAGGDKPIPALGLDPVRHGFLGMRGLRHSLAHPALFRDQLRAILRAAADHRVAVMFPMVTDVHEIRAAKAALADARDSLAVDGLAHGEPEEVGVMVEVPAAALAADELAAEVDFFSIGSNDLVQYVMAADRTLDEVASLYRPEHPAVLRLIEAVCSGAAQAGRWVGVCGEMASDPDLAVVLVGLGVRELSMAPPAIPTVKERLRVTTLDEAASAARSSLRR